MANAAASQANTSSATADGSSLSKGYDGLKIAGLNGTGAPTASKVSVEIIDMDEREQMKRRKEKEEEGAMKRLVCTHRNIYFGRMLVFIFNPPAMQTTKCATRLVHPQHYIWRGYSIWYPERCSSDALSSAPTGATCWTCPCNASLSVVFRGARHVSYNG